MKSRKSLLLYIFLNIIISAATTLFVLLLWSQTHPVETNFDGENLVNPVLAETHPPETSTPAPLPSLNQKLIEIDNVFGAGDLQNEVVLLKRIGEGDLTLTGWKLQDSQFNEYTFPELILNQGGAIQVFSSPGIDSVIELHWNSAHPIWQMGETVKLLDYQGNIRATYTIQ